MFPRAIIRGIFEAGSGFRVGRLGAGGIQLMLFSIFLLLSGGGEAFIFLGGRLGTGLKLYEVLRFFWVFLIS